MPNKGKEYDFRFSPFLRGRGVGGREQNQKDFVMKNNWQAN